MTAGGRAGVKAGWGLDVDVESASGARVWEGADAKGSKE